MSDYSLMIALLAGTVLIAAWCDYKDKNPRDATVLAAIGAAGLIGSATVGLN